jgi:hypothetical protein
MKSCTAPSNGGAHSLLQRRQAALTLLGTLLLCSLLYRVRLCVALHHAEQLDLAGALRASLRRGAVDVYVALLAVGPLLLLLLVTRPRGRVQRGLLLGLQPLLILFGLFCQVQHSVFVAFGSGLTFELLRDGMNAGMLREGVRWLKAPDFLFILIPLPLFWGLYLSPRLVRLSVVGGLLPLAGGLLLFSGIARPLVPIKTASADKDGALAPRPAPPAEIAAGQQDSLALLPPTFAYRPQEHPIHKLLPAATGERPYNVLLVVMESVGYDYALAPRPDGRMAMPFLAQLAQKGYLLKNHYSSGNSSPRSLFSLFSGLYAMPEVENFALRQDLYLPSLASFLGERYRRFLVTPGSLDYYFPRPFWSTAA